MWPPIAAVAALLAGGGALYANADTGQWLAADEREAPSVPAQQGKPERPAAVPAKDCAAAPVLVTGPACGTWFGVYVPPSDGSLLEPLEALEDGVGRKFDVVFTYHDMSRTENGDMLRDEEPRIGRDRLLLLGWESEQWDSGSNVPWRDIADGEIDSTVIDRQAKRIKAYGKPVLLGFDGEMELRRDSGTPAEYVAAYRHIVDRFKKLRVTNVAWVWGVTGWLDYQHKWKAFYPGDKYVDWISYDPYNFAQCRDAAWQDFEETVKPAYDWFVKNGFGDKPFIISEYGTESDPERPQARGRWYADVPKVLKKLPRIKAVLQWNAVDSQGCDFRLQGPGVLGTFGKVGKDPYLNQELPKKVS
ncbi:glycosyl hydrolase [Spongiactinospora sp. TRM90649]|uniref:glycoside hydrolase family 26 protein n=1 Tax=Spongiactinospora sp. TRM90649 TaxID=3031114 RepID=UPI0023F6B93F|nr:glycosyl hydrolase [Spongiactinospora sp. TRM90649]MDF5757255.1 glycosyl hydrolase [Spongiactinospora sp. TRM90649]